jgi:hypothetical protein
VVGRGRGLENNVDVICIETGRRGGKEDSEGGSGVVTWKSVLEKGTQGQQVDEGEKEEDELESFVKELSTEQREQLRIRLGKVKEEGDGEEAETRKRKREEEDAVEMTPKKIREKRGGKEEIKLRVDYFIEIEKLNVYECTLCNVKVGESGSQLRTPKFFQHFRDSHSDVLLELIRQDIKYHPRNPEGIRICNVLLDPKTKGKRNRSGVEKSTPLQDLAAQLQIK